MVKDEDDIIYENLIWHFCIGFPKFIIVDDTDRIAEKKLLNELAKKLALLDQVEITSRTQRSNGEPRKATVLILR